MLILFICLSQHAITSRLRPPESPKQESLSFCSDALEERMNSAVLSDSNKQGIFFLYFLLLYPSRKKVKAKECQINKQNRRKQFNGY